MKERGERSIIYAYLEVNEFEIQQLMRNLFDKDKKYQFLGFITLFDTL